MLLIAIALLTVIDAKVEYSKDGDFMIGAILPLTTDCTTVDAKGVALAEAIVYGFDKISRDSDFQAFNQATSLGYEIRDNCGKAENTRKHALDITTANSKAGGKDIKVVISAFTNEDINAISILKAGGITQVSYSADNARLKKEKGTAYPITDLISVYPTFSKKILVAADIAKTFQFDYVYGIANDNVAGSKALDELDSALQSENICLSKFLVSDASKVSGVVDQVVANPKIRVVVVHCSESVEMELYKEMSSRNITDVIIITTQNFKSDQGPLKPYQGIADGMLDIYSKEDNTAFESYMRSRDLPFRNRPWLQTLFTSLGGNQSCLTDTDSPECLKVSDEVRLSLEDTADETVFAHQAVLAAAFALKKSKADGTTILDAIAGLHIDIASLALNPLVIGQDLTAERSKFAIGNYRLAGGSLSTKWIGLWDEKNQMGPALNMRKKEVVWKNGIKSTPLSVCSESCLPGSSRSFTGDNKCCWTCVKCADSTASNATNADSCATCPAFTVIKPDQTGCEVYKLLSFQWFGVVGAIIIVLMIVGVILVFFGLAVFSQHSHHELVINSGYSSLSLFLLSLLILIFAPIPLLMESPTVSACFAYTVMFNLGISIVIGILISRSAKVNSLFDDNGELARGSLGPFPRTLCVVLVVVLQLIVTFVAYRLDNLRTLHNETEAWNERYNECATWASGTFWAGFTFNILASVVGNSLSCSSIQMEENCYELKYVLISYLMFYLFGIIELVIFFRCNDEYLAGGQAVNAILFALAFYFAYAWPKIYAILFRSKGDKVLPDDPESDDGSSVRNTAISAAAGFKGQGIVGISIREEEA